MRTKQVVHIADIFSEPPEARGGLAELAGARTLLIVPMLKEQELVGSLGIYRQDVKPFTDKQIALVQNFAAQAVIAIENARLLNELRQRTDDLSQRTTDLTETLEQQMATSEVLQVISRSAGDLEPVFASMLENAVRICDAKFGIMNFPEPSGFRPVAMHNVPEAFAEFIRRDPVVHFAPTHPLARAAAAKQVVHIPDLELYASEDAVIAKFRELSGARTILHVPMLKEEELVGIVSIYRQEVHRFTDKQIELVKNFAAQAVIAIENARLLKELRQRTTDLTEAFEQQTATSEVLDVISRSAFDLHAVFETVVESSAKLCGADRALILRLDGELLRAVAFFNATRETRDFVEHNPMRVDRHSIAGRAALEHRAIHNPDIFADPEHSYGVKAIEPVRTVLAVPILKGDDLLGVISIYHLEVRPFTDKQIALVETFADQAAIAIDNVRLLDELRELNQHLEQRVADQVGEIERTGSLRRFLPPQVADLIVASGSEKQLESHRTGDYGALL